jgi:hypothetical protein
MTSPLAHNENNVPFYFPESWETYLTNQFIPNSPFLDAEAMHTTTPLPITL